LYITFFEDAKLILYFIFWSIFSQLVI
jgi:hypothetical protein